MLAGVHVFCIDYDPSSTPTAMFASVASSEAVADYLEQRQVQVPSHAEIRDMLALGQHTITDYLNSTQMKLHCFRALRKRLDTPKWSCDYVTARCISRSRCTLYRRLTHLIRRYSIENLTEKSIFHARKEKKMRLVIPPFLEYGTPRVPPKDWASTTKRYFQAI